MEHAAMHRDVLVVVALLAKREIYQTLRAYVRQLPLLQRI